MNAAYYFIMIRNEVIWQFCGKTNFSQFIPFNYLLSLMIIDDIIIGVKSYATFLIKNLVRIETKLGEYSIIKF